MRRITAAIIILVVVIIIVIVWANNNSSNAIVPSETRVHADNSRAGGGQFRMGAGRSGQAGREGGREAGRLMQSYQ